MVLFRIQTSLSVVLVVVGHLQRLRLPLHATFFEGTWPELVVHVAIVHHLPQNERAQIVRLFAEEGCHLYLNLSQSMMEQECRQEESFQFYIKNKDSNFELKK
jgi:hypothetical protein